MVIRFVRSEWFGVVLALIVVACVSNGLLVWRWIDCGVRKTCQGYFRSIERTLCGGHFRARCNSRLRRGISCGLSCLRCC
jgi:hypothetical protein